MKRLLATALALAAALPAQAQVTDSSLAKIKHVLVIYAENRSFDHLYGLFPGANGIANATDEQKIQRGHDGQPLPFLPLWRGCEANSPGTTVPNGPFRIDLPPFNCGVEQMPPSPIHAYFHNREQINGGRNDRFVATTNVGGWTMGHIDGSKLKLWQWATEFTLADNFYMGAFGGSFLNHQYLVCACAPTFPDAPPEIRVILENGHLRKKEGWKPVTEAPTPFEVDPRGGQVTSDGYAVNTTQPWYQPSGVAPTPDGDPTLAHPKGDPRSGPPMPPQTARTIADALSDKGVDWAWYSGAWRAAEAEGGKPLNARKVIYKSDPGSPNFQPHHQPLNYYERFKPGSTDRAKYLRDGDDLTAAIANSTLPQVAFYKPAGADTQHPSYTTLARGDAHIDHLLTLLRANQKLWSETLVIVTYDENGGFWDHAAPPSGEGWGDAWGPGTRIPAILIGPFAKKGHIDHTSYDTGSILKFLTRRFALEPLPGVRARIGDLTAALSLE